MVLKVNKILEFVTAVHASQESAVTVSAQEFKMQRVLEDSVIADLKDGEEVFANQKDAPDGELIAQDTALVTVLQVFVTAMRDGVDGVVKSRIVPVHLIAVDTGRVTKLIHPTALVALVGWG